MIANKLYIYREYDPTKTTVLRNLFVKDSNARFDAIIAVVKKSIVDNDCFGLQNKVVVNEATPANWQEFSFKLSQDKVRKFMDWIKEQIDKGLLDIREFEQIGTSINSSWMNKYIFDSYKRGLIRARYELIKAGYGVPSINDTGGIEIAMTMPIHIDRIGLLYTRVYSDLKGITDAMDMQISRILAQGMADGDGPMLLARKLVATINGQGAGDLGLTDTLGRFIPARTRAAILARTEIIRAHHQATIQEYRNWAVEGVLVKAELVTAGDSRVCSVCETLEKGNPYTLDQIENMIPVHPNCFIDPQIPIYTSKGWVHIGKIKIGDYVLTHKNRFKKVYALPRSIANNNKVITFTFKGGRKLSITENHLVLVGKKEGGFVRWKEAGKCNLDDSINILANECKRCKKDIPFFKTYCSQTCISLDVSDRQWKNPDHRKTVSEKNSFSMIQQYNIGERDRFLITKKANTKVIQLVQDGKWEHLKTKEARKALKLVTNLPEHRKAASDRMKKNNPMMYPEIVKKAQESLKTLYLSNPGQKINSKAARARWGKKGTWIEQRMSDLLDQIGIDYIPQYPILQYKVDFAIPSLKIIIECDGEQWHQDKEKDLKRQKKIENEGWFVLRYTGTKINQCIDDIKTEVLRVFANHTGKYHTMLLPIVNIKKWEMKRTGVLYNLSVEDDESYIAKGVIVHNCRCCTIPLPIN